MLVSFFNERLAPEVATQPLVDLHHWRIFRRSSGSLHVSAHLSCGALRITSQLIALDSAEACLVTESGRRYRLCAPPEEDQILASLIVASAVTRGLAGGTDVSGSVWHAIVEGAWPEGESALLPSLQ